MIELLGQPPDELLNYAVYKHKFFIETKSNSWRFQTIEEYGVELLPQAPNKLGFSSLDDLKMIKRVIPAKAAEYKQCIKLMKAMLTMDQNKRITPNEVLQHPFITHLNNEDTEDNKDTQDNKDTEDTQDTQDNEDNEDTQDNKDTEDNEDTRDNKDTEDTQDNMDTQDIEDTQDNMDTQDIEDTQDNMDTQDIEDTQDNMIIKAGVHHGLAKPSAKNPQNKFYQFPDKYEFLKVVGQGGFGKVLRCLERDTDSLVAIKIPSFENSCRQEVAMLRRLMRLKLDKHNIVKFHGCFSVRHGEALVFESLETNLYDYLYYNHVTLADSRTIIKQIATALKALKNIGVIHTDIKLQNIMLVDKKPPLRAKLIDFGLAMDNSTARQGMELQPVGFRAPEIILGMPFSEAIDMWSVAACYSACSSVETCLIVKTITHCSL
nr:homeodomain-interacting protein kinase 3-like isoform X1 [Labrus bergylta]